MKRIKQLNAKWGGFSVVAFRYISLAVLTVLASWLMEVGKEGFATANNYDWIKLGVVMSIAALNAVGALQNKSFSEAENQPEPSDKVQLK